jgi:hypothetical protein
MLLVEGAPPNVGGPRRARGLQALIGVIVALPGALFDLGRTLARPGQHLLSCARTS